MIFYLKIEIVTTRIVHSRTLKTICRQLLSAMNALKQYSNITPSRNLILETGASALLFHLYCSIVLHTVLHRTENQACAIIPHKQRGHKICSFCSCHVLCTFSFKFELAPDSSRLC